MTPKHVRLYLYRCICWCHEWTI